ncbi:hypothetical protein BKA80DRAFT_108249 [Phyllosticta citrichinensis]
MKYWRGRLLKCMRCAFDHCLLHEMTDAAPLRSAAGRKVCPSTLQVCKSYLHNKEDDDEDDDDGDEKPSNRQSKQTAYLHNKEDDDEGDDDGDEKPSDRQSKQTTCEGEKKRKRKARSHTCSSAQKRHKHRPVGPISTSHNHLVDSDFKPPLPRKPRPPRAKAKPQKKREEMK